MKRIVIVAAALLCTAFSSVSVAQTFRSQHRVALQWISWDYFGQIRAGSQNGDGSWPISGGQQSRTNSDYLRIDGTIFQLDPNLLLFQGSIVTRVGHIAGGQPCIRNGSFEFIRSGQRRYWRLKQMQNPCDGVTDYVDIFFD